MNHEPADITELAAAVAAHLDGDWTAKADNPNNSTLTCTDGRVLELSNWAHRRGQTTIKGNYPEAARAGRTTHSINVGTARGSRAMASEITRRLLPAYDPEYAAAQEYAARSADDDRVRAAVVAQLLAAMPGSTEETDRDGKASGTVGRSRWGRSFAVHYTGTSVDVTLPDLTVEQSLAVARLLAKLGVDITS